MEMRYTCVGGQFDQPPRGNIFLEAIEDRASAGSNHARNTRVTRFLRSVFRIGHLGGLTGAALRIHLSEVSERLRILRP